MWSTTRMALSLPDQVQIYLRQRVINNNAVQIVQPNPCRLKAVGDAAPGEDFGAYFVFGPAQIAKRMFDAVEPLLA